MLRLVMRTMRAAAALLLIIGLSAAGASAVEAQDTGKKPKKPKALKTVADSLADAGPPKPKKLPAPPMFASEKPLELTLTTNIKQIKKDKNATAPWRSGTISYRGDDGKMISVPVRVKTRGIWRLKHCDFPPIRVKVADKAGKGTWLEDLDEPKLVTYCRNLESYEQYVLQEAQLYRINRLVTDISHKVRLLRLSYADSASGKVEVTRYSFLIEDPAQVARRANGAIFERKGATADDLDPDISALAFTFQYFIGNTDFSFGGLHNGEVIALPDGRNLPVSYDFDFAGAIDAAYAGVDPQMKVSRVRDRQFRGYCSHEAAYPKAFAQFIARKDAIYSLYRDEVGQLISPKKVTSTLGYYDDFYESIKTPKDIQRNLFATCVK